MGKRTIRVSPEEFLSLARESKGRWDERIKSISYNIKNHGRVEIMLEDPVWQDEREYRIVPFCPGHAELIEVRKYSVQEISDAWNLYDW